MKKFLSKINPFKWIPKMFSFSLKIRTKLILAFGIPMMMIIALVAAGIWQLEKANSLNDDIVTKRWARLHVSNEAINVGKDMTIQLYDLLAAKTKEDIDRELAKSEEYKAAEEQVFKRISEDSYTETGSALVNEIAALRERFLKSKDNLVDLIRAGKREQAMKEINEKVRPLKDQYVKELENLKEYEASRMGEDNSKAAQEYQIMRSASIAVGGSVILASILMLWLVTRAIVRPISRAAAIAQAIAEGRFDNEIKINSKDETGVLLQSMASMQEQMGSLVANLRTASDTMRRGVINITEISENINTASKEIAAGNSDLSTRTEEQAASLEETTASMQTLASTVLSNEKTAQKANELARSAAEAAVTSQQQMVNVAEGITAIEAATRKITSIVDTVKEIAYDTNLLSFNAAIEAERAGEAGRGFGVVAAEVRELSKKSRAAVVEIQTLVSSVLSQISEGTESTGKASKSIDELREMNQRVSDMMQEISQASSEQSQGIEQVHRALNQMSEVTQQNSALVEEASATAQNLQDMAGQLVVEVGNFNVSSDEKAVAEVKPAADAAEPQPAAPAATVVASAEPPKAGGDLKGWERH